MAELSGGLGFFCCGDGSATDPDPSRTRRVTAVIPFLMELPSKNLDGSWLTPCLWYTISGREFQKIPNIVGAGQAQAASVPRERRRRSCVGENVVRSDSRFRRGILAIARRRPMMTPIMGSHAFFPVNSSCAYVAPIRFLRFEE